MSTGATVTKPPTDNLHDGWVLLLRCLQGINGVDLIGRRLSEAQPFVVKKLLVVDVRPAGWFPGLAVHELAPVVSKQPISVQCKGLTQEVMTMLFLVVHCFCADLRKTLCQFLEGSELRLGWWTDGRRDLPGRGRD